MSMNSASRVRWDREAIVRVMVVDDQSSFRRAAGVLIDATPGFELVGDVDCGAEALRRADQLRPDLVLMDVYMPEMDGLETARQLTAGHPECVVVLVSLEQIEGLGPAAASSGASAIMRKEELRSSKLRDLWTMYGSPPLAEG